eukprot:GHUV01048131.1.p1 GENE.GHUV01048131.1~~GHUV01048131.1.p1  ORF type:complete len:107 (-),score=8.40 GHUV01048131.1:129-449(-)
MPCMYSDYTHVCCLFLLVGQLRRLMLRDGSTEEAAQARITSQMPLAHKVQLADRVLNNDGDVEVLQQQVGMMPKFETRVQHVRMCVVLFCLTAGLPCRTACACCSS